ncbi:GCP60-like protein [Mya arenaria]|uniref:GCP60-like protein n=1 Tax=Mya arenaria TaxID=6604 RepID=A0ABY7F7Y0_MYAAR|nr:GCP60-like protein [Mya arenaria]
MADKLAEEVQSLQLNGNSDQNEDKTDINTDATSPEFTLEELYKLALHFYKDQDGKGLHLSYRDKLRIVALTKQVVHGKYTPGVSPDVGFLDVVGNDRKQEEEEARRREQEESERKALEDEAQRQLQLEKQRQQEQEKQIRAALNQQTAQQFRQYAAQQFPGNTKQQEELIAQLQEQHFQQYMQQVYQQQLLHQQQQYQQLQAMQAAQKNGTSPPTESPSPPMGQAPPLGTPAPPLGTPVPPMSIQPVLPTGVPQNIPNCTLQQLTPQSTYRLDLMGKRELPPIAAASMWTKKDVKEFKELLKKDKDSVIKIGSGETVTVRVPTHEDGSCLFWEFATDYYDIGFGVYFEWTISPSNTVSVHVSESSDEEELEDEDGKPNDVEKGDKQDNKPPVDEIIPVYRRDCHEEVYCGSHAYPGRGVYLLKFDNSYSLWRSKTLYYRVYYSR